MPTICSDTTDNPPNPKWISFPIADDATKYEAVKGGKLKGARKETFEAIDALKPYIDALKPYRGGNDLLWSLFRLNSVEKYRLLLTVGSQAAGIHLGHAVTHHIEEVFPPEAVAMIQAMDLFINPADKGFPLEAGFELFIGAVDEKPNPKQQFRFSVALGDEAPDPADMPMPRPRLALVFTYVHVGVRRGLWHLLRGASILA